MRVAAAILALVAALHAGIWLLIRESGSAPATSGQFNSLSFAPFNPVDKPDAGGLTSEEQIRADLKVISPYTRSVRTYAATGGLELVPRVASEFGMRVTLGAWVDKNKDRNERELQSVVDIARKSSNINGIVVGNETILRDEMKVDELIQLIQRVKREVSVPVTTGEIWNTWLEHPELVSAVDYLAVHILPYWEGVPEEQAADQAIRIYERLRLAYPGKRIVIAEFGWPSAGYNLKQADPGTIVQGQIIRDFVSHAERLGIEYNIVEAFDQPWKSFEGSVGPYWGVFDANRNAKFPLSGEIDDPNWGLRITYALIFGVLISIPILSIAGVTILQATVLAAAAHFVGAWFAIVIDFWASHYFVFGAVLALGFGVVLLVPLVLIALYRIEELAEILFGLRPQRLFMARSDTLPARTPKVSIHIPAHNEPSEMLKQTLDSIARLEWPALECIVIVNNTPDPALWQPVQEHCLALGERFKFLNVNNLAGFKAGALRLALEHTAEDAEIIGVIDADYVVAANWLRDLVPAFDDPTVGLVQAPQDHRDGNKSVVAELMNGEYAGFFDIGMVQRNEANAIVVHGTMCLVRRAALIDAGNWSSDTICEDTDLGLTMLERGWRAHYTNRRYGWGLLPDGFEAYKKQRHRWAYGGIQIIRKHWRRFLPGGSLLTTRQRLEFLAGWIGWLGAETLGVIVALLNILWVPVVVFAGIAIPERILTMPILATFLVTIVHFLALYFARVDIPARQAIGSAFAAMGLQFTIARAVAEGVVKEHLPFIRTNKGGLGKHGGFPATFEAIIGFLLIAGAALMLVTNKNEVKEIYIFAIVLVVQSLPFLSAAAIAVIERSAWNDFASWRKLGAKIASLIPGRVPPAIPPAIAE
jgi:exo-beta-1,3-glucanase (GH17 family)/cellulose synthase/poly-beta-1,6-N-acetylglucosamine synthase-like glycosyltransferase